MTEAELRQAISLGREQRGIEFKGPGKRTDRPFHTKVVRAVLGMANKRDGGIVVIGVGDNGTTLSPIGLSAEELDTWSYDDFASIVSTYADPYIDFNIETVKMDGNSFIVIEVKQFDEHPVICKRPYNDILRNGALYVRPHGKNETIEVPSHAEMRQVVELAADIVARKMVASYERLQDVQRSAEQTTQASTKSFDAEVNDLI